MNTSFSALFPFGFPNLYHPIRYSITPPPPIAAAGLLGPDLVDRLIVAQTLSIRFRLPSVDVTDRRRLHSAQIRLTPFPTPPPLRKLLGRDFVCPSIEFAEKNRTRQQLVFAPQTRSLRRGGGNLFLFAP